MAERIDARSQRLGAGEDSDEGRLAGAVHAHQRHTVAALDKEIDPREYPVIAVTLGDPVTLSHDSSAGLGLREFEVDGVLFGRNLNTLDPLQLLDAALHLFRLGGLVAEPVDESLQLRDPLLLIGVSGQELRTALVLLLFVARI